jgi:hypothetical protein
MRLAAAWWAVGIALCIALLSLITQTLQARALLMILAKLSSGKPTLTIHEEAKGTQQPIVVPNVHKTLNLVLEEEIDKPWKDNDPQVRRDKEVYVISCTVCIYYSAMMLYS